MEDLLKILVVDDDEVDRIAVRRALKKAGVRAELTEACTCGEAISVLKESPFDCAFLDFRLPDQDGLALVQLIREAEIQIPLIILTGQGDEQVAVTLMKAGATDYLVKSQISPERLAKTLSNAMRVFQAEQRVAFANQQLQDSYALLVQKNQELEEQRQQIQLQNVALQQTIAEREQLALQQKDFIAHLTHDLRTPLFACDTMLKMFQKEVFCPLPEDMHGAIAAMIRSNFNLIQIVDALLEVHCHEAGMKAFNFIPCDLWAISSELVQELQPLAAQKGITLTLKGDDAANNVNMFPKMQGDHLELRRMLTNLLGNSIKFTESGSVELRLKAVSLGEPDLSQWLILEVQDTGFGMTEAEQETLFERFRKGTHKQSSSGLGLHLVYRIVQIHHGSIEVHSKLGQGSLFTVRLPV